MLFASYLILCYYNIEWETDVQFDNTQFENCSILLGSSHAIAIAQPFEVSDLNSNCVKSLALPGGGMGNLNIEVKRFLKTEQKIDNIIFFVDPFMIFTKDKNKVSYLKKIKFDFDFLNDIMKQYGLSGLKEYLISYENSSRQSFFKEMKTQNISNVDSVAMIKRYNELYRNSDLELKSELQTLKAILKIFRIANPKVNISLIIPPVLLGELELLRSNLVVELEKIGHNEKCQFFDHSSIYNNPNSYKMFNDYDHLNNVGQLDYKTNYIDKIINQN